MIAERIHSWHSNGGGSTSVELVAGSYRLGSNYSSPDGLNVTVAGFIARQGPGTFVAANDGPATIEFGTLPRIIELWRETAPGAATAPEPVDPASVAPAAIIAPGEPPAPAVSP